MKIFKSKIVNVLLLIIFVLVISLISIDKKLYNDFISAKIAYYIKQSNFPILIDSPKIFFIGLKSDNVSINVPLSNVLLLTRLTNCIIKPQLRSFLSDSIKIFFSSNAYDGNISGEINYKTDTSTEYSIEVKDVNASLHPQLASINIKGGKLNIQASNIKSNLKRKTPIGGFLNFNLQDLSIPLTVGIFKSMIPLDFKDDLKDASITLNAQFSESKITIDSFNISSNFVKITGNGEISLFELQSDRIRGLFFNVDVAMTDKFKESISPTLIIPALVASHNRVNGKLNEKTKSFSAKISGSAYSLLIDIKDTTSNFDNVGE